jgi:hypothetical protein
VKPFGAYIRVSRIAGREGASFQALPQFMPSAGSGTKVVADTSDRTRDRFAQRAAAYALALGNDNAPGWLSPSEVRQLEGMLPEMAE